MNNQRGRSHNKKNPIVIASIIVGGLLLIIASVFGYNYWSKASEEESIRTLANDFVTAMSHQEYEDLTELIVHSRLEEIDSTPEEVINRYQTIFGGIGVTQIEASDINIVKDQETEGFFAQVGLTVDTALGPLPEKNYELPIEKTDDGFKVIWSPALIFPEMEIGDTVQFTQTPAERGSILDRSGELLAGQGEAYQAGMHPSDLGEGDERMNALQAIAEEFGLSIESLENLLSQGWVTEGSFVPFGIRNVGETPELTGVLYQKTTARQYPLKEAGAHLIGYVGEVTAENLEANSSLKAGDQIGKSGLEAAFDKELRGEVGGRISILDESGEISQVLKELEAKDGEDIHLTIDKTLQTKAFESLGEETGAAVVIDPQSGELLVLASTPSYDPIKMSRGISTEDYQTYAEDARSPFLARYASRYAPGSTFKVLTGAIGYDHGTLIPEEKRQIKGLQWTKDESWGNDSITRVYDAESQVDLETAYIYSDNIYFAQEALEIGRDVFQEKLEVFPFGQESDLPFTMQAAQFSNDGTFHSEKQLADTAYGQGQILMSPVQQAVYFSVIANGGKLPTPVLVSGEDDTSEEMTQAVSIEAASLVTDLLIKTVTYPNGTANQLADLNLPLAAKTGTAEFMDAESQENETNGFLLTFDAENKNFLMISLIENKASGDVMNAFKPFLPELFSVNTNEKD